MINSFIKKNRKLLIIILIPYLSIILLQCIKIDWDLTAPADIDNVGDVIVIEGKNSKPDINTVSVYSYSNISVLDYLLGRLNKKVTLEKTYAYYDTNISAIISGGEIQKNVSVYNSIIAAYNQANASIEYTTSSENGYIIHTLATYASSLLKIGDQIIAIDNQSLSDDITINKVISNRINHKISKYDNEVIVDDTISLNEYKMSFTIKRKGNIINIDIIPTACYKAYDELNQMFYYPLFGISTYPYNLIKKTDPEVKIYEASTIGPSGGLMQALYIYETLTDGVLTKDLKIVGTGTVDAFGNAGPIGGIYQKVQAAHAVKADIFFVPVASMDEAVYKEESNYQEALASYETIHNPKMVLIPVASLQDIINYLISYQGGNA